MISPRPWLKGMSLRFIGVLVLWSISGCADYQVRMPDSDPNNEQYQAATMNAYVPRQQ